MSTERNAFEPRPIVLAGEVVRLEPLSEAHTDELFAAGSEEEIWCYMPWAAPRTRDELLPWIRTLTSQAERGLALPFRIVHVASGRTVGSTSYLDIDRTNRRVEIGATWLGPEARRTAANTEAKLLLLRHAFETLGAYRVQFKTDARNVRSQRALERIGAQREGVLRRHLVLADGFVRDSVYYGIVDQEWPAVHARLRGLLDRPS